MDFVLKTIEFCQLQKKKMPNLNALALQLTHPRRPRGGPWSGQQKRLNESFQVRAKEPLGTDSHRTISKIQVDAGS